MKQRTLMLGMVLGSGLVMLALVGLALLPSVVQASPLGQTATPSATTPDTTQPGLGFRFHHGGSKDLITATANVTGLTAPEVVTQLQSGQTLAQIAEAHGQTAEEVIIAARALLQEQLDENVAAGWITQAQADAALTQFDETAPDLVNSTALTVGRGHGFGKHGSETFVSATASITGLTNAEVLAQLQSGQTLAQIAEANGQTAEDVIAAARTQLEDLLEQAVTDGRLTQVQADAKLADFDATASTVVNSAMSDMGHGHGRGGHGRGGGVFGRDGGGSLLSATVSVTGLTTDEVIAALQSGQTLAQIAEANGQTAEAVIDAARTQLEELLAQAVTDGRLTQAQADAKLANFDATAAERMNSTYVRQPHGPHGQWPSDHSAPETTPAPSNTSLDA